MYRFAVAALASPAWSAIASDETSLMQGLNPTKDVLHRTDKSKAVTNLLSTASSMLKNGATPDVVEFAQATLAEIRDAVYPAITDAHAVDQALVDSTFEMFEMALAALEAGTEEIKQLSDEERSHSAAHKLCRAEEEDVCYTKRECDYDLYAIWRNFVEQESIMRQLSTQVSEHFCVEDANGTMWIFRDHAVTLFPPFIEQKPIVERWEGDYDLKVPECETKFAALDEKTALCDAHQTHLENAACAHAHKVNEVREEFSIAWDQAILAYQTVVDEVHCLEIDRWKEWRSLSTVQCLLDRTTERNGRPCDDVTDEEEVEMARCEGLHTNTSIDHLIITYYQIPPVPPFCVATPWDIDMENPGRCVPQIPHTPCSQEYFAQEYAELWIPPQPEFWGGINFEEGNSHCNQRQDCSVCDMEPESEVSNLILDGHGNDFFVLPQPEHECHSATRFQIATGHYVEHAPDAATCQVPVAVWRSGNGNGIHYDGEKAFGTRADGRQVWQGTATCEGDVIAFTFGSAWAPRTIEFSMSADKHTFTYATGVEYIMQ